MIYILVTVDSRWVWFASHWEEPGFPDTYLSDLWEMMRPLWRCNRC